MRARQYEAALKPLIAASALQPKNRGVLRDIGECEYRIRRYEDALKHLTRSIELSNKDWWTYNLRYHVYIELREYKKALIDCQKCLKLKPDSIGCQKDILKLCKTLSGDPDAALILADRQVADPVASAKTLMKSTNYKQAIDILTKALKTPMPVEQKVRILETRRKCFFYTGDHARNLADLNEIIRLQPGRRAYVYLQRANAESALKKFADSARDLTTVISMSPTAKQIHLTTDELYYRRAFCYIELKQYQKAIADLDTLLKIDPTQEEAYKLRGECNANLGKNQLALKDFAEAIKYDQESSGSSYYARASVYEKMGKKKEAEADRKRAFELGYVPKVKENLRMFSTGDN